MTKNGTKFLREYIAYIPQRLAYLKIFNIKPTNFEWKYYSELYCEIKEYLKQHEIFGLYIMRKIGIDKYKAFYGVSERTSYRILAKQRVKFIRFILQKEKKLFEIYPFEDIKLKELQNG